MRKVFWMGSTPTKCDLCDKPIVHSPAFYDAKTDLGPWGMICPLCFPRRCFGVGLGKGQKYERQPDGRWLKTEG